MLEGLAAFGAVAAMAVAARSRERAVVALSVLGASGVSLAVSVTGLVGDGRTSGWLSLIESCALIALVFLALRRLAAPLGALAATIAGVASVLMIPAHETSSDSLLTNVAGMAVWACGVVLAAMAARHLDELEVRRARSVADARREQRLSLARDLHDFVAHDVSAIVVEAQAAQVVGAGDPAHALAALKRIEEAGVRALGAMDRAVDALREMPPKTIEDRRHGLEDLPALTARFERTASVPVRLDLDDDAAAFTPAEVGSTAYRLVTEALTNVRRHASHATRVSVTVARLDEPDGSTLSLTVANDGVAAGTSPLSAGNRNGGFGLYGLAERVEALGGELRFGPDGQAGWKVSATLPLSR